MELNRDVNLLFWIHYFEIDKYMELNRDVNLLVWIQYFEIDEYKDVPHIMCCDKFLDWKLCT